MDLALNDRCRSVLRPLLVAAFVALAWLIWGAGTANASLPYPDPLSQLTEASASTLEDASAADLVSSPMDALDVASPLAPITDTLNSPTTGVPLPAATELPVDTVLPVTGTMTGTAATVTDAVTDTVTDTVVSTVPTVGAGLGEVVDVVSAGTGSVLPVVTEIVEIVDAVVDVPTVPIPPLPGPDVVTPGLPAPLALVPGGLLPGQEGPNNSQGEEEPGGQPAAEAAAGAGAANGDPIGASQDSAPAGGLEGGTGTGLTLLIPPALPALPILAAVGDSAVSVPAPEAPVPVERQIQAVLAAGQGSGSAGSAGGGAQAWADVAGFWAVPLAARGARMPTPQQLPPAGPAFDPGSTPD